MATPGDGELTKESIVPGRPRDRTRPARAACRYLGRVVARPPKNMSRWLGDGGMAILETVGLSFEDYGVEDDDQAGWATARWKPTQTACNPHGTVQAGVHSVVLDAAMNFAVNAGLPGRDRTKATIELKTETMRAASAGELLSVRGAVMRQTRQIAFAEARVEDDKGRLVSRSTGTFLIHREE